MGWGVYMGWSLCVDGGSWEGEKSGVVWCDLSTIFGGVGMGCILGYCWWIVGRLCGYV